MSRYLKFKSILTKNLTKDNIKKILSLKKQVYNFSLTSHRNWFKKNMNSNDINNLLIYKSKIVGYTALRTKKCILNKKKTQKILIFDTFLIKRELRKKGFGSKLMIFNNLVILRKKTGSVLLCNKSMTHFYKFFNWKILNKKKIKFQSHKIKKKYVMTKDIKKINHLNVIL
jgi:hypothetical protein